MAPDTQIIRSSNLDIGGPSILRSIIKDHNLLQNSDRIFFAWFNLRNASAALCDMLGRDLQHEGMPIADKILMDAIEVYMTSVKNKEAELKSVVRYLSVLSDAAFIVQKYSVFTIDENGKKIIWPYFTQSIRKWLKQNKVSTYYVCPVDPPSTDTLIGNHILMSARIMTPNDLGKLMTFSRLPTFNGGHQ